MASGKTAAIRYAPLSLSLENGEARPSKVMKSLDIKTLGVNLNEVKDLLEFSSLSARSGIKVWIWRTQLRCVASVYDLVGIIESVVITWNIQLQRSWKEGGKWHQSFSAWLTTECHSL